MPKKSAPSPEANSLHPAPAQVFASDAAAGDALPIWLLASDSDVAKLAPAHRRWLAANGFKTKSRKPVLIPEASGAVAAVAIGASINGHAADPMARAELLLGLLAAQLPAGSYRLDTAVPDPTLAAIAWGLGGYTFDRYKSAKTEARPQLVLPAGADAARVKAVVAGAAFGRDLINTPASDMGPAEIETAARTLAAAHGATISSIVGDALLAQNFPLIHAVGRASPREPRLIDLIWEPAQTTGPLPKVTLVGKGIAFDTGGLDIKPSSAMLIMKKDMGGAATVLAAAHMIMAQQLPVRLRVVIAAAENAISGNAFRPLDVIKSRAGLTVEIGNTDAEGRLVLADALALADAEMPDVLMSFATLTGAARVALGPDLPPYFTDDDAFAAAIATAGVATADPVWRLPFWNAYEAGLDSGIADLNNVSDGPFAGAIVAALFLRRFVKKAQRFAHFDIYGWRQAQRALGPKGGEVNAGRAIAEFVARSYPTTRGPGA